MSSEQAAVVVGLLVIALVALGAGLLAWRALARTAASLAAIEHFLDLHSAALAANVTDARTAINAANAAAERTLWALGTFDKHVDAATAGLTAKRAASDRLRVRLEQGEVNIARLRDLARLLIRLSELRREFL